MQKRFHVFKLTSLDTMYNKSYTRRSFSKMCQHWKSETKKQIFSIFFLLQPTFQTVQTSTRVYYINTEKYLPKSYLVNFYTQTSSTQSEERTMVFTREKYDTSNKNSERCVRHMIRPIRSHRGVRLIQALVACSASSQTLNEESFSRKVFIVIKMKNISKIQNTSWKVLAYGIYA